MAKERLTQSQIDGVDYRRAKLWQIILVAFNAFNGMAVFSHRSGQLFRQHRLWHRDPRGRRPADLHPYF